MLSERILTWFLSLIGLTVAVVVIGVVVLGALAATGDPGLDECRSDQAGEPPRGVSRQSNLSDEWQAAWDGLNSMLDQGQAGNAAFSETQTSSRAEAYMREKEAPIEEVAICFHNGDAEAKAKVDLPVLGDIPGIGSLFSSKVKVRGTIDLDRAGGPHPRIVITDLEAGNMPSFASDQLKGRIEDIVNQRLDDLNLDHDYTVTFVEGTATVAGEP